MAFISVAKRWRSNADLDLLILPGFLWQWHLNRLTFNIFLSSRHAWISRTYTVDSRIADTSLLHPDTPDKSQPSGQTHKEMTEKNSRYYGLSLLRKWGHFPAPKRDISLVFSLAIADTRVLRQKSWLVKHKEWNDVTIKEKNEKKYYRPFLWKSVSKWLLYSF